MSQLLKMNVKNLSGVGEQRAKQLEKAGVSDIESLLYRFPRSYEFRGNVKSLAAACDGEQASFVLTVATKPTVQRKKNNLLLTDFLAFDQTAKCSVTYFNNKFIANMISVGETYRFFGKAVRYGTRYELVNPIAERVDATKGPEALLPLYPVYSSCGDLGTRQFSRIVEKGIECIEKYASDIEDLPASTVEKYGFVSRLEALKSIHFPKSFDALNEAKRRLSYEEIYKFALHSQQRKKENRNIPSVYMPSCDMTEFKNALAYELTDAQKRTVNEIYRDMVGRSRSAMRRLICGDVGSGKTICAAAALYICVRSGYQGALMVPTEVLARQHYSDLSEFFARMGIRCELLLGDTPQSNRTKIYKGLTVGDVDIVIGTVALITDKVIFSKLGLVICDEQHRFGVNQRNALLAKGDGTHMLLMSATPIPRSLALVMFGELDVSLIDQLPPGRQKVDTFVVGERMRERVRNFIREQIKEGRQIYIVCPSVDETEDLESGEVPIEASAHREAYEAYLNERNKRASAVTYASELAESVFPEYRVEYLHGKMKPAEKEAVMSRFFSGETDILVSTTVIEVGVNVPNASVMVVENAECFGLSQLHQLRGRVGRGKHKSYCILISSSDAQTAVDRLKVMKECSDGYKIAEYDLKQRGPGDFIKNSASHIRQHGELKTSFGSLLDDTALLYAAFEDAKTVTEGQ